MVILGNIFGFLAILLFVGSYQFKKRKTIVISNTVSRLFYVLQYIFLGAWTGAIIDFIAMFISWIATNKDSSRKNIKITAILILYALIIASSVWLYENPLSILSFFGVTFELMSFMFTKERNIRIFSFIGQPFWLIYNISYMAWSSAIGNTITMISIIVALMRYDIKKKKTIEE